MNRRELLAAFSTLGAAALFSNKTWAQATAGKTLVVVFMRGGVDGVSMLPPLGDPAYAKLRPTLRLYAPEHGGPDAALRLDATFGLHPALSALKPFYDSKQLAAVHAVGQANPSRSHFDAQDFLESGTPGRKGPDGWLNRAAAQLPEDTKGNAFRVVALQNALPYALMGDNPALALPSLREFKVGGGELTSASFESLYEQAVDDALRTSAHEAFDSLSRVKHERLAELAPRNNAKYPKSALAGRLQDIARLIHGDVGLSVAVTEATGFDTHLAQGAGTGQLANKLSDVGNSLAAFATDLGERLDDVCLVTMTEFGRTAQENGSRGTDHGTASALFVMGGGVRGGRVYADWPSLAPNALYEGRDLAVTCDIRQVLSEVVERFGLRARRPRFPGLPRGRRGWACSAEKLESRSRERQRGP